MFFSFSTNPAQLNKTLPSRAELMCRRCDEWRVWAGSGPDNTRLSFPSALSSKANEDVSKTLLAACVCVSLICRLHFPVSLSLSPVGHTEVAEVQEEDDEMLPFLPQSFYGGLMIYCSDFSLFSSYLEGGQFNKHACFLPRPSDGSHSLTEKMCYGATVCSTAVTQFRDFFTTAARNLMGAAHRCASPKHQACSWSPMFTAHRIKMTLRFLYFPYVAMMVELSDFTVGGQFLFLSQPTAASESSISSDQSWGLDLNVSNEDDKKSVVSLCWVQL